ncbi:MULTISPECIES: RraA family protein [Breoghania]|uniref:Putative 4-hydroxy-4-methyl-2-oxoglutarate aldolase n=1 Tax=Breoghania corrubedonensis TaxID=665038 RepID=A0A2T5V8Y6_9HYPH|nr:RraA family protein [Breoghania corrubedonensis]PTW60219.1 regulator of RNase E activity RraA [Breoghania corrubedonensis]
MTSSTPDKETVDRLIAAFRECPVPNISDNMERAVGARGIRPFHKGSRMAGRARTVRTNPGDNLFIYKAFELVQPGDIVVVDGGGYEDRALIGEIMSAIARSRGAAGMVLDGAVRDADALAADDFPVFARAVSHLGPYKNGPGKLDIPVSIGGLVISPGDIVVGDCDGIVAFPPSIAEDLLAATLRQQEKEADILASIANGTYAGAYGK